MLKSETGISVDRIILSPRNERFGLDSRKTDFWSKLRKEKVFLHWQCVGSVMNYDIIINYHNFRKWLKLWLISSWKHGTHYCLASNMNRLLVAATAKIKILNKLVITHPSPYNDRWNLSVLRSLRGTRSFRKATFSPILKKFFQDSKMWRIS